MAGYETLRWESRFATGGGLSRYHTSAGDYQAYVPDPIAERRFVLDAAAVADLSDAERAITKIDAESGSLANTEALARLLLRAESVASSRIEGLEISPGRLLRVDAASRAGDAPADDLAHEVLANVEAMAYAVAGNGPVTLDRILEMHRRLLAPTRLAVHGGRLRTEQNWIGGNAFGPFRAAFVPPSPARVPELMDDLCRFCRRADLPPVAQAAIAHSTFETIHPFVDGNGRTGRALIHMMLRSRGVACRTLVPVSLIFATFPEAYIRNLSATRYVGDPAGAAAVEGLNSWLAFFAGCCTRAVADASSFEAIVENIVVNWRERLRELRSDSSAWRLISSLAATPVVTARSVEKTLGVSPPTANATIQVLVDAGVLQQVRGGRRSRAFEAQEIVDAFTRLERQLATPAGDTSVEAPVRAVPRRRSRA